MKSDQHQLIEDCSRLETVLFHTISNLKTIRDLKAHNKSSIKTRLTKIDKHVALSKQLIEELVEIYGSKTKTT